MGLPKFKKPSDLREDLYNTLDRICLGEMHIVPTKNGDVVLLSRVEYEDLIDKLEIMKDFERAQIDRTNENLESHESVFKKLDKKMGWVNAGQVGRKSKKRS